MGDAASQLAPAPLPPTVHRLAYLGTPAIATAPLEALIAAGFDVAAVVTGLDRRRGRGSGVSPTPVKTCALSHDIPVFHDPGVLPSLGVDLAVVVAYGTILDSGLLAQVPMVNIHFSLLPRWRGAAPVERAILAGDTTTGVCIMQVEVGLDTGGVLQCADVPIDEAVTAAGLSDTLSALGAALVVDVLTGPLPAPVPQHGEVTYAHKVSRSDVELDWMLPAVDLARRVRVGGAWTVAGGRRLKVTAAWAEPDQHLDLAPGKVVPGGDGTVLVATGTGTLVVSEVIPEGRSRQQAADWLRGQPTIALLGPP